MTGREIASTLFTVVMTWAALKTAVGAIISPMRGRELRPRLKARGLYVDGLPDTLNTTGRQQRRRPRRRPTLNYEDIV